jgi:hypothetical protein
MFSQARHILQLKGTTSDLIRMEMTGVTITNSKRKFVLVVFWGVFCCWFFFLNNFPCHNAFYENVLEHN